MIKFLIKFASFIACAGILALGGYQTIAEVKIDEKVSEIETALENTPTFPEFNNPEDGEGDNGKPDEGGSKPDDGGNKPDDGGNKPDDGGNTPGGEIDLCGHATLATELAKRIPDLIG